jgi:hypothetical protein
MLRSSYSLIIRVDHSLVDVREIDSMPLEYDHFSCGDMHGEF